MKVLLIISKFWPEYCGPAVRALNTYANLKKDMSIQLDVLCGSTIFNSCKSYKLKDQKNINIKKHSNLKETKIKRISYKFFSRIENFFLKKIYYSINFNIEFFLTYIYLIKHDAKEYNYFHVYGNNSITNAALSYAKNNSIPAIVEVVTKSKNFSIKQPFLFKIFQKSKFDNLTIICISKYIFQNLKKTIELKKLVYKTNPISTKFRFKKNIIKEKISMLCLGKFMPNKNQIFLLEVMKILPNNYFLDLVGPLENKGEHNLRDLKYFLEIKNKIKYYKIEKRVNITNKYVNDPRSYYSKSNICLFPFINEGLGTPVLESVANGRYVIVNDENKNFIDFYNYRTLFNTPLIPELWAKKILSIPINNKLLKKNSKLVLSKYNLRQDTETYRKIIKRITQT